MEGILKVHGLAKFTREQLLVVITTWLDGEWDLFVTIKHWVDVDYESRKQHLDSLMSHVRFSLLTPAQLKAIKKMKMYSTGSWRNNVLLGEDYHSRPIHKKMMRPTSVRSKPQVVCFSDEDASSIFALQEDGKWTEIDVPHIPEFIFGVHAVLEFNNFLIIASDDFDPTWHVFDVSTFKWSEMPGMKKHTCNFALVHDGRFLYALGGSVNVAGSDEEKVIDTIERYDPGSNTWTVMKTKLPKPLVKHSACVCSGPFFSIYVAGGWDKLSEEGNFSDAMNCFNPYEESATWHRKAHMLIPNAAYVMREMAFDGKNPAIVIVCDDLLIQYYNLKTDQWSVTDGRGSTGIDWHWHKNGTILSDPSENTLYILNVCEEFPGGIKKPKQGVCAKWPLSKLDENVFGVSIEKFPIEAPCWGHCADPNYLTALLAIPTPAKRRFATAPSSQKKTLLKAKRSIQHKSKC